MPRPSRTAAAVVVVRHAEDLDRREVLLCERNPKLRFFGGYHAFVGGVRDAVDGPDEDGTDGDRQPLRRCALRELFEETGLLVDERLVGAIEESGIRTELREELLADRTETWGRLIEPADGDRLREFCRITTPPFAPVRYATAFFVVEVPADAEVDIVPGELTGGAWWRPGAALEAWTRGDAQVVPPALILLEILRDAPSLDAFCTRSKEVTDGYAAGDLHRVQFSPGVVLAPLATETLPPATTTNCLIVGRDALWIVDPASPDPREQKRLVALVEAQLARAGASARVAGVLSTHHHPDHVGGLAAACRHFGVETRAHARTLERLPPDCPRGAPLADGDTIPLGTAPDGSADWTLEALYTPGHDRGHLCFRESRYGALVAGDMVSTISTIVIDPPEGHLRTYLESLERLRGLEIGTIYPAHGPAVNHGVRVLERYLAHRAERERSLLEALDESTGRTPSDLVKTVYADTPSAAHALAERSLLAGLEKLRQDGRAQRDPSGCWIRSR